MKNLGTELVLSTLCIGAFLPNLHGGYYRPEEKHYGWTKKLAFPAKTVLRFELKAKLPVAEYTHLEIALPTELNLHELSEKWISKLYDNAMVYPGYGIQFNKRRAKREVGRALQNSSYDFYLDHPWGERASFFPTVLKQLDSVGLDGKNCLLRAVCEMHEDSLESYGLFGEVLLLIFSTSKSPLAKTPLLREFLRAERMGRKKTCEPYYDKCSTSIFQWYKVLNETAYVF